MSPRTLRYAVLTALWVSVAAYMLYAGGMARRERKAKQVARLAIEVVDSTAHGHLVSAAQVRKWIAGEGIRTVGAGVGEVDLPSIERLIARNGFVDRVAAYVTYDATLHVKISQRRPVVRLLTDGMNVYVTSDGYVFASPQASSLYVPVVTGPYRPPFPGNYTGYVRAYVDARLREVDGRIEDLEREKYPLYKAELENDRNTAAVRRMRTKRQWWRLERSEAFERRVEALRERKAVLRRVYRYKGQEIQRQIEHLGAQQDAERQKQKNLEKSYEDFVKLLTFVETVEEDDFWRSEVVQITARTTSSGALEVELVPRSGGFTIRFGRLERVEEKFDKLLTFYRRGLSVVGWDTYRLIDVRYAGQVVCRE